MIELNPNLSIIINLILLINTIDGRNIDTDREIDPLPIRRTKRLIISNGEEARIDDFPWMAMLLYYKNDDADRRIKNKRGNHFMCAGSLLNDRYILTAAHCISGDRDKYILSNVRLGEYNRQRSRYECGRLKNGTIGCHSDTIDYFISWSIRHPEFNGRNYDIGLIRLAGTVKYTDYIRPIRLPESSEVPNMLWAAGWGDDENNIPQWILKKVELPYYDWNNCSSLFPSLVRQEFCTAVSNGKDTCHGDSGGPVMAQKYNSSSESDWFIYGISVRGFLICSYGDATIATKVYDYVPWIMNKTNLRQDIISSA